MIMNFSRKIDYQYNDHERIRSKFLKFITKIMITNDWSIIHYQDNGNEVFLGRVITGNLMITVLMTIFITYKDWATQKNTQANKQAG